MLKHQLVKAFLAKLFTREALPYWALSCFGLIYFTIVICNHYFFRTSAWDYGAYNFGFYDYAHLRVSENPVYIKPHITFLQDHVSFTFFLFIPLYWIFSWLTGTYTLLLIQTSIILWGGWAVYKLVELKTTEKYFPILALLQYLCIFGRWPTFIADCNLAIMAASLVPVFLYYFEKKSFWKSIVIFLVILSTREDMALWTAFIGLFLMVTHFKDKLIRNISLGIIIFSIFYFVFTFKVIIPTLETSFKKFSLFNYTALGANPSEALLFIIKHPFNTLKMLFVNHSGNPAYNNIKLEFYYVYLACGGFLLFFRPKYVLLFIPLLAKKLLNDDPIRWSVELYYSIEFVSILPAVVFLILSELKNKTLRYSLAGFVCVATIAINIIKFNGHSRLIDWWGDRKHAFYKSGMYKADFDVKETYKNLDLIPPDAKVSASTLIVPHLAFRDKPCYFPRVDDADYIALFKWDMWPLSKEDFEKELAKYTLSSKWHTLVDNPTMLILKKNALTP